MSNLENKEEKVVNKIVSVVNKLDKELDELDTLSENPEKKHNLKNGQLNERLFMKLKKFFMKLINMKNMMKKNLIKNLKKSMTYYYN